MERFNVFSHIAERTAGSIYVGVVGPVRTGKSTFIKRFMDLFVMPGITDVYLKERTRDELPQSGAGRTITTTEPKFVPDEPVEIMLEEATKARIRLVDCVGYTVASAKGYMDEEGPRLVRTPWFEHPIPFQEAAELGTRRVITEHSTIGLVVTTDGSISDLPRSEYAEPEGRVIEELQALGKPFVVVLNSIHPQSPETTALANELRSAYGVQVLPMDCLRMTKDDILTLLGEVLLEFPLREFNVRLPKWVEELASDHWLRRLYEDVAWETVIELKRVKDVKQVAVKRFADSEHVQLVTVEDLDLGIGKVTLNVTLLNELFYHVLAEMTGLEVQGDHHLMRLMQDLTVAKREYVQNSWLEGRKAVVMAIGGTFQGANFTHKGPGNHTPNRVFTLEKVPGNLAPSIQLVQGYNFLVGRDLKNAVCRCINNWITRLNMLLAQLFNNRCS
jgi:stage IV sporulation protein A